ncbi:MAG: glycosyltransferase family 2 protein [Bacilli bacterium]
MKISLITVCYNSKDTIEDTLKSVLDQTYKNYEYIIVDGKSNDNTIDIVNKYKKKFGNKLRVISEKDKGLYDAMNKGINLATGEIIGILNSDDILANKNVFQKIVDNYDEETDILYGDLLYCNEDFTKVVRNYISGENKSLTFCPAHPTMYVRKKVYDKVGKYDIEFKVDADYDFMIRANKAKCKFKYLHEYLVLMRIGGTSNGIKGYLKNFKDCYYVLKNNDIDFPLTKTVFKSFKTLKQIFLGKLINKALISKVKNQKNN